MRNRLCPKARVRFKTQYIQTHGVSQAQHRICIGFGPECMREAKGWPAVACKPNFGGREAQCVDSVNLPIHAPGGARGAYS